MIGALLLSLLALQVSAYSVVVPAGKEICFYEEVTEKDPISVIFQVVEGGYLDIDASVRRSVPSPVVSPCQDEFVVFTVKSTYYFFTIILCNPAPVWMLTSCIEIPSSSRTPPQIFSPDGTVLYKGEKESDGRLSLIAQKTGTYAFCFSNAMSTVTGKTVRLHVTLLSLFSPCCLH